MDTSTAAFKLRPTIFKEGADYPIEELEDGIWPCPFCEPAKRLFTSAEHVKEHIHTEHAKKQVQHNGLIILKCNQDCGVLRERSHYHCPSCDKAVISRGDFVFHLKGHDMKRGLTVPRGRKKTLATVMNDEAGVQHIQLFSHASLVVSPTILSLIDDQQIFWNELGLKSGMTCLRDEGQQFCVLQGQYDSVIKANSYLERYVLEKLRNEVSTKMNVKTRQGDQPATGGQNDDPERPGAEPVTSSENAETANDVRKSGRKRKPNALLDQYVTAKSARMETSQPQTSSSAAIRKSTVAQTLKTTVEQECHVTLSKNMQSGEYQVHLMFPAPIITQPPEEPEPIETDGVLDSSNDAIDEDNPLADLDDDDADEDYKVDPEIDNAASEEEMDPDADEIDKMGDKAVRSQSNIMITCHLCQLDFRSIDSLVEHRQAVHNLVGPDTPTDSLVGAPLHYCRECTYSTSMKQMLKLHISRFHREKQLECLDCGQKFGPLVDLKTHIKDTGHRKGQHTNLYKQMVECKICNKRLQLKNLKPHTELVHDKVKPFSCDMCGKMFGTRFLVKEHMESHKNLQERNRPWKCTICGQAFFKKLPLDEHMAKHMGSPQYQCDQCPKKFYHQSGWKRHMQHHGEARPFACAVCGKTFKTSTNLSAHKTVHAPTAFMCLCGKSYQQRHTLRYHQEKCHMHQDILTAQLAEEQYQNTQRYMCGFCQETFTDFAVVQEHVKQHVPDSVQVQVEGGFGGTLDLTDQQEDPPVIAGIDGSGLEHLAMTAALEQQNMEGRTLIVTDLGGEEQLQLMAYPNTAMVDQSGQVLQGQTHQLIDQDGRIIGTTGPIDPVASQLDRSAASQPSSEAATDQPISASSGESAGQVEEPVAQSSGTILPLAEAKEPRQDNSDAAPVGNS